VADGDHRGCESNIAASITKLADGDEQLSGELGYDVAMMCRCWEARDV